MFDILLYGKGEINENYKMIGNAVPVKLAEVIAKNLRACLERNIMQEVAVTK